MTYELCEADLATQVKATSLNDDQVSIADFRILGYGHPCCAILEYGGFTLARDDDGSYDYRTMIHWVTRVHLFSRYSEDAEASNVMRDKRDEIVIKVLQVPQLGGANVFDSLPLRGAVDDEAVEIGGVVFLHESIDVELQERVNV